MALKLHVGCGPQILPGWINLDRQAYPGVDRVVDIRDGLPYENADFIFAEHFLEHLSLEEAIHFLCACRRTLAPAGVLRLSTPNLDWVWLTHYRHPSEMTPDEALKACLELNRAFKGWGHQFLFNAAALMEVLRAAGFARIAYMEAGQSAHPELAGLERHFRSPDAPDAPSVIVAEADGVADYSGSFRDLAEPYMRDFGLR